MTKISNILASISHRPFELPSAEWKYYQEWNNVLFLHWKVPFEYLRKSVPQKLNIDIFNGSCYVSLLAFTMQKIRPRYLPSISFISDFEEINLRTYVNNGNKPGVYFLNIEGGKSLSVFVAKLLSGLPYEKADIKRSGKICSSKNHQKKFFFDTEFSINEKLQNKSRLDEWLTERYCLYLDYKNDLYRYDIHHKEWEIKDVSIEGLNLNCRIGDIDFSVNKPDIAHYSDGVKVIAWEKQRL